MRGASRIIGIDTNPTKFLKGKNGDSAVGLFYELIK